MRRPQHGVASAGRGVLLPLRAQQGGAAWGQQARTSSTSSAAGSRCNSAEVWRLGGGEGGPPHLIHQALHRLPLLLVRQGIQLAQLGGGAHKKRSAGMQGT